jgi:hypothetical protein
MALQIARVELSRTECEDGSSLFESAVDVGVPEQWYLLALRLPSAPRPYLAKVEFPSEQDGFEAQPIICERGSGPFSYHFEILAPLPGPGKIKLSVWGNELVPDVLDINLIPISRLLVGILCILRRPVLFLKTACGLARQTNGGAAFSPRMIIQRMIRQRRRTIDYSFWLRLFGSHKQRAQQEEQLEEPAIAICLFAHDHGSLASRLSLNAVQQQLASPRHLILADPDEPKYVRTVLQLSDAPYVGILQAGEILQPDAIMQLRSFLREKNYPDVVYADEDRLDGSGRRSHPLFKPEPSLTLMHSGTLSRGVWVVRHPILMECSDEALNWAETARLESWFQSYESGWAARSCRLASVLTSRHVEAESAPVAATAAIVSQHLARAGLKGDVVPGFPMHVLRRSGKENPGRVSVIIPTTLGSPCVIACIRAVLQTTEYADVEFIILIAQPSPLSEDQSRRLAELEQIRPILHIWHRLPEFNYATANNVATKHATGSYICFLNDDVQPIDRNWLSRMVAFFDETSVGIVGAKLYYITPTCESNMLASSRAWADLLRMFTTCCQEMLQDMGGEQSSTRSFPLSPARVCLSAEVYLTSWVD